jgi:endoribonuclease Dicer
MTVSQQQNAISKFRDGRANLLVATSVVEEGFNVAECNVVIRLDAPSTVTALVQYIAYC